MIIHFERSGGFAGMTLKTHIDVETLPPAEAEALKILVDGAGIREFKSLPEKKTAFDQFTYVLTIEQEDQKQSVLVPEQQIPPAMEPLIRYLMGKVRGR